jgi:hypothetical protein
MLAGSGNTVGMRFEHIFEAQKALDTPWLTDNDNDRHRVLDQGVQESGVRDGCIIICISPNTH